MLAGALFSACGGGNEEVELPTKGLITTVKEVEPEQFKIEDEVTIEDTSASLIVAKYLDGKIDTFTLQEARLVQQHGSSYGHGSMVGPVIMAASAGYLGYMMGRRMSAGAPPAGAYTNPQTHSRIVNSTGSTLKSTSARVSRPRSGFGGGSSARRSTGGSTRGFGG